MWKKKKNKEISFLFIFKLSRINPLTFSSYWIVNPTEPFFLIDIVGHNDKILVTTTISMELPNVYCY